MSINSIGPVIVNLAPTGMVPTAADSPHVPLTVERVVADVVACAARGANVVHLHARDDTGAPTWKGSVYGRLIEGIREVLPDLVLGVSLSGRNVADVERRADPLNLPDDLLPDLASLTLSSMNFARTASVNSPEVVMRLAERMAQRGVKPEMEVFDTGMVMVAERLAAKGLVDRPLYYNLILGNAASAQPTPTHLAALLSEMGPDGVWTAGGIGRHQLTANALGLVHGAGVRVGLEDNLWYDHARTVTATNPGLVDRVVDMARLLGRAPASPGEVRRMLGLGRA